MSLNELKWDSLKNRLSDWLWIQFKSINRESKERSHNSSIIEEDVNWKASVFVFSNKFVIKLELSNSMNSTYFPKWDLHFILN